jgi:hypothetical protein
MALARLPQAEQGACFLDRESRKTVMSRRIHLYRRIRSRNQRILYTVR